MPCSPFKRVVLPTDDPETAFSKKVMLLASAASVAYYGVISLSSVNTTLQAQRIVTAATSLAFCLQMLFERQLRQPIMACWILFMAVTLLISDLVLVVENYGNRTWPYFVVLIDLCLVCRVDSRVATSLVVLMACWIALLSLENVYRFGVYDLWFLYSQEERRASCDCASLPCPVSISRSLRVIGGQLLVFFLDFYFTRSFAHGLQQEHENMNKVIATTEDIATSLSRFDLEAAEGVISTATLPPPLYDALCAILGNLHIYRPYLPQSCLHGEAFFDSGENSSSGLPSPKSKKSESRCSCPNLSLHSKSSASKLELNMAKLLERKRCTFTVTNMLGSHEEAARDIAAFQEKYKVYMEEVLSCYSRVSGVVGIVVGDHVHASFNAARRCASHATSAVQGAVGVSQGVQNVVTGVATGMAHCGSLGCSDLMSVVTISPSTVAASDLQEFARNKELSIVVSGSVYSEVSFAFNMKIILEKVATELVYDLAVERRNKEMVEEEWMYQLEERPWDTYNTAGKQYLLGDSEEALRVLEIERERSAAVEEAEEHLIAIITQQREHMCW